MAKRGYGSGSITERGADRWLIRANLGADPVTGARSRVNETVHGSKKDAQARLTEILGAGVAPSKLTVGGLIDEWKANARIEPGTLKTYEYTLRHIPAPFLKHEANKVTPPLIQKLVDHLVAENVGPQTIRKCIKGALSSAFAYGLAADLVRRNPVLPIKTPTVVSRAGRPPSVEDVERILQAAEFDKDGWRVKDWPMRFLWLTLVFQTGARPGEVTAIHWTDVDLEDRTIFIHRSLRKDRSEKGTKTGKDRYVTIDDNLVTALSEWKRLQAEQASKQLVEFSDDWYVIADPVNLPWGPEGAGKRFAKIVERAGLTNVNLYDMRHAYASWLLKNRIDPTTVAELMGHNVKVLLETYAQAVGTGKRDAADVIGNVYNLRPRSA